MSNRFTSEVIQMLENIPNSFYALDRDMKFIYANSHVLQLMRKTEAEVIGQYIWQAFDKYKNPLMYDTLDKTMSTGETGYLEQYYAPLDKWLEVYAYPSEYGLAIYVNDITLRKKTENHLQVLNRAGEYLALTHDIDEALDKISKMIVPDFADWFTIDWLDTVTNSVQLIKLSHTDADKQAWAIDYRNRSTVEIIQPKPMSLGWVMRVGIPVHVTDVNDELLKSASQDKEHLEVLKQLDIKSSMIVPMPYKGKNLGAVTFLSSAEHKRYDQTDINFAKDLGMRIGVAIENHRMFEKAKKDLSQRIRQQSQEKQIN